MGCPPRLRDVERLGGETPLAQQQFLGFSLENFTVRKFKALGTCENADVKLSGPISPAFPPCTNSSEPALKHSKTTVLKTEDDDGSAQSVRYLALDGYQGGADTVGWSNLAFVPLLVRGPGLVGREGSVIEALSGNTDLAPVN